MSDNQNNVESNRPLSPHLSIYKPQITSVLSITHRATGAFLFLAVVLLAWWFIGGVYNFFYVDYLNSFFYSTCGRLVVAGATMCFYYHLLNGIRHLFWDMGKGYEIKTVTISGVLVLLGTVLLTVLTWFGNFIITMVL